MSRDESATERTALLRPRTVSRAASTSISLPQEPPVDDGEDEQSSRHSVSARRGACILAGYAVLLFLVSGNFTLMTTIAGPIADDLDAYAEVSWFTSTYLIAMSCLSPIYGRLSDIFTPRICVLIAAVVFSIGPVISSQATSLTTFLVGRSLQGAGGAGITTLAIILVIQLTNKKRRGLFIGVVNTGITMGVSLGAIIGGALGSSMGWRALLWIQCPLALACGVFVYMSIPVFPRHATESGEVSLTKKLWAIDYSGVTLLILSLASLLYGLSASTIQVLPVVIGLVLSVAFVLNEVYRAQLPVIPVAVLKSRGALLSCFGQMGYMSSRWAVLFFAPVYAQAVRLWPPAQAGSIIVPTNAGFAVGGLLAGLLHIRRAGSFWLPSVICYVIFPITVLVLSQISTTDSNVAGYIVTVFLNGFVVGAGLNYCLAHLLHLTTPDTHFVATSLLATFRGISGSFGAAVGGGLFTRVLKANLESGFAERGLVGRDNIIRQLLGKPALVRELTGPEQDASRLAYQEAIRVLFIAAAGLACISIFVQAGTGWKAPESEKQNTDDLGAGSDD